MVSQKCAVFVGPPNKIHDQHTMMNVQRVLRNTPCPGKNGPPKQNAVKCTVYNTIQ